MRNMYLKESIIQYGEDVLFYGYKNEIGFPRICGLASAIIALLLYVDKNIRSTYDIYEVRGHYRNDFEEDERCDEWLCEDSCHEGCCCDFMPFHSWIKLIEKNSNKEYIVDFTGCQFHEDIRDIEGDLMDTNIFNNKEDLFKYIKNYSDFIIDSDNESYKNYIANIDLLSAKEIFDVAYYGYGVSDVIVVLEKMNLTHILDVSNN